MVDVSGIEWNWWASVAWWLVPVIILVLLGILLNSREHALLSVEWPFVLAVFWFPIAGLISLLVLPMTGVPATERALATEQLQEQGYEHVDMVVLDKFTASKDGQYVQGLLHYLGDNKYQVIEVPLEVE